RQIAQAGQRQPLTGQPGVDARQHQRAAQAIAESGDLGAAQPQRPANAGVERATRVMIDRLRRKAEAHHHFAMFGTAPLLHPDQVLQRHRPAGFLQRLARGGGREALAILEMASRLVVHQPAGNFLLDHQIALAIGDHAGHGDVRAPDPGAWLGSVHGRGGVWKSVHCAITCTDGSTHRAASAAAYTSYQRTRFRKPWPTKTNTSMTAAAAWRW